MGIIERLVRLNKSLLLLTKIENKQFLNNQDVLINTVVKKNSSNLEEIAAFKKVKISVLETANLSTKMNPSLANVIVSNLLRNAIFHNIPNGNVLIEITNNTLKISNTGNNLKLDKNSIFNRFYKPNNVSKGTGLGLAIVKAISDTYGFRVSYSYIDTLHCFLIKFPAN